MKTSLIICDGPVPSLSVLWCLSRWPIRIAAETSGLSDGEGGGSRERTPLATNPGQTNASGENALVGSAAFDDAHSSQHLSINQNDQRLLEKPGAGILPTVQGPNIKIEPPVKEATKITASPQ